MSTPPDPARRAYVLGVTGAVGAGKSATCRLLRQRGWTVADVDELAAESLADARAELEELVPAAVRDGAVDKVALFGAILKDPSLRAAVEEQLRPHVVRRIESWARALSGPGALESALLFEQRLDVLCDATLCVCCPAEERRRRVAARTTASAAHFDAMEAAQLPEAEKARRAGALVESDCPLDVLGDRLAEALRGLGAPVSPPPSSPPANVSVDLAVGQTRVRMRAQLPTVPTRPVRLLPLVRHVGDALITDAARRVAAGGAAVSCEAGCTACCHYLVPISRVEARHLAELVTRLPAPAREAIVARFAAARERLDVAGLLSRLREPERITPEDYDALGDAYFALGLPCPFLEDRRCTIYPERPLPCREFLVVSPPERCGAPGAVPVAMVKLPARASVASAALEPGPGFFAGGWVPLVLALEWAEAHPEPAPATDGVTLAGQFFDALKDSAG